MRAVIKNGYIIAVGEHVVGDEITQERYDAIMDAVSTRPAPVPGYEYMLRDADLTWELVELPPDPDDHVEEV